MGVPLISPRGRGQLLLVLRKKGWEKIVLNSAENEIPYNIVTVTVRGDRGECQIVFPSPTLQNPEEGGNKSPKHRL